MKSSMQNLCDSEDESATLSNGALIPDFSEDPEDPDELLSDEDAPDLQDEIAKTLTSLRVCKSTPTLTAVTLNEHATLILPPFSWNVHFPVHAHQRI